MDGLFFFPKQPPFFFFFHTIKYLFNEHMSGKKACACALRKLWTRLPRVLWY